MALSVIVYVDHFRLQLLFSIIDIAPDSVVKQFDLAGFGSESGSVK